MDDAVGRVERFVGDRYTRRCVVRREADTEAHDERVEPSVSRRQVGDEVVVTLEWVVRDVAVRQGPAFNVEQRTRTETYVVAPDGTVRADGSVTRLVQERRPDRPGLEAALLRVRRRRADGE